MFYSIYENLCIERGEKPYQLPLKLGAANNAIVAQWKKGSVPRAAMLQKIADYFGVSTAYLLGETDNKKPAPTDNGDGFDLEEFWVHVDELPVSKLLELQKELQEKVISKVNSELK